MKTNKDIASLITALPARSAWIRGVKAYALELLESAEVELASVADLKKELLNGAQDWSAYSSGGNALVYDYDICERLCTRSEFKKMRNGEKNPNTHETWLDCQSRALWQAERMITRAIKIACPPHNGN